MYEGLRRMALTLPPAEAGVKPDEQHREVWAVVVDLAPDAGTATLVGMADGSTSMYTSTGGGMIGGGRHERVAAETHRLLTKAEWLLDSIPPATSFPLPGPGAVAFHVRTYEGSHSVTVTEEDLVGGSHELSALYFAAHRVLDELRRVEQRGAGR